MNFFLMEIINYFSIIPSIVIFAMSCYFLSKRNSAEAILLVIGSGLDILITLFYIFIPFFLQSGSMSNEGSTQYYTLASVVRLAAGVFFALGFLTLIKNLLKSVKPVSENPFKNNTD